MWAETHYVKSFKVLSKPLTLMERMTGLARLRSRLPTRPRSFKQFTGLFEFTYGEPTFSSPPHCKTKRTPKRCPFILERMTGLEPATSTLARWRSTRWATSANGAFGRNRTNDTRIFSPLLYQLSYKGKRKMATRNGLEPSTSSVTG